MNFEVNIQSNGFQHGLFTHKCHYTLFLSPLPHTVLPCALPPSRWPLSSLSPPHFLISILVVLFYCNYAINLLRCLAYTLSSISVCQCRDREVPGLVPSAVSDLLWGSGNTSPALRGLGSTTERSGTIHHSLYSSPSAVLSPCDDRSSTFVKSFLTLSQTLTICSSPPYNAAYSTFPQPRGLYKSLSGWFHVLFHLGFVLGRGRGMSMCACRGVCTQACGSPR